MEQTLKWKKKVVSSYKPQTFLPGLLLMDMYIDSSWILCWWKSDLSQLLPNRGEFVSNSSKSKLVYGKGFCRHKWQVWVAVDPHKSSRCLRRFKWRFTQEAEGQAFISGLTSSKREWTEEQTASYESNSFRNFCNMKKYYNVEPEEAKTRLFTDAFTHP